MLALKNNYTNSLNFSTFNSMNSSSPWIKSIELKGGVTGVLKNICNKYQEQNKWILMVNPESTQLNALAKKQSINSSKILQVSSTNTNVGIESIKIALNKGNCSAVILFDAKLNESELYELKIAAEEGKTQCIILTNKTLLH